MRSFFSFVLALAVIVGAVSPSVGIATSKSRSAPAPAAVAPAVINATIVRADRAAQVLRSVYPRARIRIDRSANAIIVVASPEDVSGMRTIVTGIDVRSPTETIVDAVQVHTAAPAAIVSRVRALFPHAVFEPAPNHTIVIAASQTDLQQAKNIIAAIDTPPATPSPKPSYPTEAVRVTQRSTKDVARAVSRSVAGVQVAVSGSEILVGGAPDSVAAAKTLIAQLDQPQAGVQFTQVYRLHFVDAASVADLLRRSFKTIQVQVDGDLNALSVFAGSSIQQRIADAVGRLDAAPAGAPAGSSGTAASGGGTDAEVLMLKAAAPGLNGGTSTSANDIAATVTQALASTAPDLKITVPPNSTQLVLTGSPYSVKLAKNLIAQLDVPQPLVVLDTEVLEVDETRAKNLGLQLQQPVLSTTFVETQPTAPPDGGAPPPMMSIQPFVRTPLTIGVQLNLLVQQGNARILADPRITTISGRTASIRAGDQLAILTTTGGGPGTIATTQLQTFQTGVTLDITPVVNAGNFVLLTLHPTLNSLSGILNGVPQISTRDATTTVGLMDNQTLVIGGLIEETTNHTVQKIPLLGDLPLVGSVFRAEQINRTRNELIVTVTPHVIKPGENFTPGPPLPAMPTPAPLPTLPPGTTLPEQNKTAPPTTIASRLPAPAPEPQPVPIATPTPNAATPAVQPSTIAPSPLPTAFNQTNVFTYGVTPPNNFAEATGPVQIYYVQAQPTVVKNGQPITISAITTTNVDKLTFGTNSLAIQSPLSKIGPGQWQSTFNFSTAGLSATSGNVQMTLTATSNLGSVSSLPIPLSVSP